MLRSNIMAQSKLAIMLFVNELARRGVRAYAANPGQSATNITRYSTGVIKRLVDRQPAALTWTSQSPEQAARSTILAVYTDLPSGTYFAPRFKQWGRPHITRPLAKARNARHAQQLWELSVELTGCDWSTS